MMQFLIFGGLMSLMPMSIVILRNINGGGKAKNWIIEIIVALLIGYGMIGLLFADHALDEKVWNNGYCECGGQWDLVNVDRVKNGSTRYYHECDTCGYVIEINCQF